MSKLHDMRSELRNLRKDGSKPISRMRKEDIACEIQRLKGMREETPAVAAVPSAPVKKSKAAVESIKEAKRSEFPVAPADSGTKKKSGKVAAPGSVKAAAPADKKKSKLAKLMALMENLSSDEE